MATFNGIDMGIVIEKIPVVNPIERQINTYPGVNGLQILQGGTRGGTIMIKGVLVSDSVYDLEAMEQTWHEAAASGVIGTFVDDVGGTYGNCLFIVFRPEGQRSDACVMYTIELLQIF
ncbi:MAG: hypothetical protein P4L84_34975 [Isosphaeraceae bacterium]|nr:hypothetical protein [Isosphaeraceae bacterium]